jgi:GGDEF domain-containing protein
MPLRPWESDALLAMGGSLRLLAVTLILVLSGGLALLFYAQLPVADMIGNPDSLLGGFGFLMLLAVGYLISKHWSTSRNQRALIEAMLEEESVSRALQHNPITDFHHPDVCRDILVQQASHAARLHAPLSVLEVQFPGLAKLAGAGADAQRVAELIRAIRGLCRATDSVLRWTPESFLLAFPEVTREELAAITDRLRLELDQWLAERFQDGARLGLAVRGASSSSLESSGDILLEIQRLLERESRGSPDAVARRDKGIALTVELEIRGETLNGKSFEERIVTERVSADRLWCYLKNQPMEYSPLIVAARDGSFTAEAVLTRWSERDGERLAEIRFSTPPARWVIKAAS